jgi:hypothetical protein
MLFPGIQQSLFWVQHRFCYKRFYSLGTSMFCNGILPKKKQGKETLKEKLRGNKNKLGTAHLKQLWMQDKKTQYYLFTGYADFPVERDTVLSILQFLPRWFISMQWSISTNRGNHEASTTWSLFSAFVVFIQCFATPCVHYIFPQLVKRSTNMCIIILITRPQIKIECQYKGSRMKYKVVLHMKNNLPCPSVLELLTDFLSVA